MNVPSDARLYVDCPQCGFPLTIVARQIGNPVTCENCLEEFSPPRELARPSSQNQSPKAKSRSRVPKARSGAPSRPARKDPATGKQTGKDGLRLDDDLSRDEYPINRREVLKQDYDFTVECPLCQTRLDVTDKQIGRKIRCPDCHSRYTVREPSPRRRRPRGSPREADEELRLSPPIDRPAGQPTAHPVSMLPTDLPDTGKVFATAGEEALRNAEQQSQAAPAPRKLPRRPLIDGITMFLFDIGMGVRCIFLALALQIEILAIEQAIANAHVQDGMARFGSLTLTIFSIVFGFFLFLSISVTGLTLLRETASGKDRVEIWPGFDIAEWFVDSLFVIASLTASLVVGCIIGRLFVLGGNQVYAVGMTASCAAALVLAFPPMLLSALEAESPIQFTSTAVWRGLRSAAGTWFRFILMTGLLVAAAFSAWRLRQFELLIVNYFAALVVITAVFIFFWQLGRLAWAAHDAFPIEMEPNEP